MHAVQMFGNIPGVIKRRFRAVDDECCCGLFGVDLERYAESRVLNARFFG